MSSKLLSKELSLYERDEKGVLIPQEVELMLEEADKKAYPELVGQTITCTPLPRGELKKLFGVTGRVDDSITTDKDDDGDLILSHCFSPKFTKDEIPFVKPVIVRSIVKTILSESGVKFDSSGTKNLDEDEFAKNSRGSGEKSKKDA